MMYFDGIMFMCFYISVVGMLVYTVLSFVIMVYGIYDYFKLNFGV